MCTDILRHFNPEVKGFSTGVGKSNAKLNVAVSGAVCWYANNVAWFLVIKCHATVKQSSKLAILRIRCRQPASISSMTIDNSLVNHYFLTQLQEHAGSGQNFGSQDGS